MKIFPVFTALFLLLLISGARAGEINWPTAQNTVFTNNIVSTNITATTIQTNSFTGVRSIYHTFEFDWTGTGTNAATNYLDYSVSGINWTNAFTIGGTASYSAQVQLTGVFPYFRERSTMYSTNGSMNTYYAGH
jgi:hypothetical protein